MKLKMAADQVLKRFSRQIRKEDAFKLCGERLDEWLVFRAVGKKDFHPG